MKIKKNISLKKYNTFGIDVLAKRFVTIDSLPKLQQLLTIEKDLFILGGGSNILLTKAIEKLVVFINIKGISIEKETENYVYVRVNSGENWHQFVLWCIAHNYGGLENLSLIPGNVGSCPIQNIGAYGVEVKNTIVNVVTSSIKTGKTVEFSNQDCEFKYRNSIFKSREKGNYIITSVCFKLTKNEHQLNISYGAIKELLDENNKNYNIKNISDAVIYIRKEKLPNLDKIGNGGSFFKNPVISESHFKKLQEKYPTIPFYKIPSKKEYKIPAGWLIEQSGFKGKRFGDTGTYIKQALILVNYGDATGIEIQILSQKIKTTVLKIFGIDLEIEINIV